MLVCQELTSQLEGYSIFIMDHDYRLFLSACRTKGVWLGLTVELDLEVLHADSLVQRANSISLEIEAKDKFSKNLLYSSIMSWRQMLTRTSSSLKHSSPGLSHEIFSSTGLCLSQQERT